MANKSLFSSAVRALLPRTDTANREHAPAYAYSPRHKLAQLAATGTLNGTFYATAELHLAELLAAAREVEPGFVARTAVWARRHGHMKDTPALLCAYLSTLATPDVSRTFPLVIDNGRMLRSFVQIMRSGAVGRRSLGTRPKRLVKEWLESASPRELLHASVGQAPSLADVIRMVHPHPADAGRAAAYAYLIGKPYDVAALPAEFAAWEAFKRNPGAELPDVPFQMLTALPLETAQWAEIAENCSWQTLRMNLATFARHGVLALPGMAERIAQRLADAEAVRRAKVFPYQLLAAYTAAGTEIPALVREALQDALEMAVANVPEVPGAVVICPDVSGSMRSPVTGYRKGATSAVRCVDAAALMAASLLRQNRQARVLPFEQRVVDVALNPRDTVLTNANALAAVGGGGTACAAPLVRLNEEKAAVDLVVMISDNQSWVDATRAQATGVMAEWTKLKARSPGAKLVCIDIQPHGTAQAAPSADILNVGGFSDVVFDLITAFAAGRHGAEAWVEEIERIAV